VWRAFVFTDVCRLLSRAAGEGKGGGRGSAAILRQASQYRFDHTVEFAVDFLIPEAQDTPAVGVEPGVSAAVACEFCTGRMRRAIHFDDDPRSMTEKIRDIGAAWRLSPEL